MKNFIFMYKSIKSFNPTSNPSNEDSNNAIKEHIDYEDCKITKVEIKHGQGIGTSCIDPKANTSKIILYLDIPDPEWKITSKFRNSGFGKKIGQCNILKQQSKSN